MRFTSLWGVLIGASCFIAAQTAVGTLRAGDAHHAVYPGVHPDGLDEVLAETFYHGIPIADAKRALKSPHSVERLSDVIQSWDKRELWENATLLMGLSGDRHAYESLIEFLKRDDSEEGHADRCVPSCQRLLEASPSNLTSREVYFAKANVPIAIGLWLYTAGKAKDSNPTTQASALGYLKACSQPRGNFWSKDIKWQTEAYPGKDLPFMYADLSEQCIEGLGLSGNREAGVYLEWMIGHIDKMAEATEHGRLKDKVKEHGYSPEVVSEAFFSSFKQTVVVASKANRIVAERGLEAYYARKAK